MEIDQYISFLLNYLNLIILAVALSIIAYSLFRVFTGLKLNLYFLNSDSKLKNQSIIPVSQINKKKSIFKKNWNEDLEISLSDYNGNSYPLKICFTLWNRYKVSTISDKKDILINNKLMKKNKSYKLTNKTVIKLGDGRKFKSLITPQAKGHFDIFGLTSEIN